MSAQFGKCNFEGKPVDPEDFDKVRPMLVPYGPDGEGFTSKDNFAVLYRAFHTTKESRREVQPYIMQSGSVLTWDGRLDNRSELIELLGREVLAQSTDLEIVAALYERWETDSFAKLIGDWALSIWEPETQTLILAKDFIGARHLYFSVNDVEITWCTALDPLLSVTKLGLQTNEEYIAGYLASLPSAELTPYVGIHAVPPSSFVKVIAGNATTRKYWDFDPAKTLRYSTDSEYEEHFREILGLSVRRRLRSDVPILAELSGGLDSSSIVCVADDAIRCGTVRSATVDTISYYDDLEPNWNERPYFRTVENKRGRTGCHIDLSREAAQVDFNHEPIGFLPDSGFWSQQAKAQFTSCMASGGHRALLSGLGGDEVMGGVPTPLPELQDLIAAGDLLLLVGRLKIWSLNKRKPWMHLLFGAVREFLPLASAGAELHTPAPWIRPEFAKRNCLALNRYNRRLRLFGPAPSFQHNLALLEDLRRQVACSALSPSPLYETRRPYLDRSLLEFIHAIPREQLVRPGQRRSLMRRALKDVVPDEILNRRRKAFVARAPRAALSNNLANLLVMNRQMIAAELGVIDQSLFRGALLRVQAEDSPIVPLLRTLLLEAWLRKVKRAGVLTPLTRDGVCKFSALGPEVLDAHSRARPGDGQKEDVLSSEALAGT